MVPCATARARGASRCGARGGATAPLPCRASAVRRTKLTSSPVPSPRTENDSWWYRVPPASTYWVCRIGRKPLGEVRRPTGGRGTSRSARARPRPTNTFRLGPFAVCERISLPSATWSATVCAPRDPERLRERQVVDAGRRQARALRPGEQERLQQPLRPTRRSGRSGGRSARSPRRLPWRRAPSGRSPHRPESPRHAGARRLACRGGGRDCGHGDDGRGGDEDEWETHGRSIFPCNAPSY